ncbi:MAG: lipoate--protein ligase family protein [Deltaproteobacteria bacterium]|nr:lipoate--protein ligase family protein [Deltaproteobacteria bacterium]
MRVRFLCQEDLTPALSLAIDQFFLQTVRETGTSVLRVYSFLGDVVLLGRYHELGELPDTGQVTVARRLSGGRGVPAGQGFVQFSLILPHRSAFFSDDPYNLAPFQVLNRYVRGVLQGLKAGGIDVFYPGRDLLTVRQQPLGWISFTIEDTGALLCEGGLAVSRDFSLLPYLLDRADPQGTIPCQFFTPEQVTSIERMTGRTVTLAQVAGMLRHGFAQQPTLEFADQDLSSVEQETIAALAERQSSGEWLQSRPLRPDLPFHATTATQLGVLQVRFSLTPAMMLADVQFSGDLIANLTAITVLEQGLRGCPLERDALWRVVDQTFLQPQHYLLGIGPLEMIPDTLLKGYAASSQ